MSKLNDLVDIYGFSDLTELVEDAMDSGVCPSICTNKDCTYTDDLEPDCSNGYCEDCKTKTVKSAMVIAGII